MPSNGEKQELREIYRQLKQEVLRTMQPRRAYDFLNEVRLDEEQGAIILPDRQTLEPKINPEKVVSFMEGLAKRPSFSIADFDQYSTPLASEQEAPPPPEPPPPPGQPVMTYEAQARELPPAPPSAPPQPLSVGTSYTPEEESVFRKGELAMRVAESIIGEDFDDADLKLLENVPEEELNAYLAESEQGQVQLSAKDAEVDRAAQEREMMAQERADRVTSAVSSTPSFRAMESLGDLDAILMRGAARASRRSPRSR